MSQMSIPIDPNINWNCIPKEYPPNQWKVIIDRQKIAKLLIKRNINHLNQEQGTPCTILPMKHLFGVDSFTEFGNDILKGVADFSKRNQNEVQKCLFTTLQRSPYQLNNVIPDSMSIA